MKYEVLRIFYEYLRCGEATCRNITAVHLVLCCTSYVLIRHVVPFPSRSLAVGDFTQQLYLLLLLLYRSGTAVRLLSALLYSMTTINISVASSAASPNRLGCTSQLSRVAEDFLRSTAAAVLPRIFFFCARHRYRLLLVQGEKQK